MVVAMVEVTLNFSLAAEDVFVEGVQGGGLRLNTKAARELLLYLAGADYEREDVEGRSPELVRAIHQVLVPTSEESATTAWRSRVGRSASFYHDQADAVIYTLEAAAHLADKSERVRQVPAHRISPKDARPPINIASAQGDGVPGATFDAVLDARRSHRVFRRESLPFQDLAYVVNRTFGSLGEVDPGFGNKVPFKRTVAAGSRHEQWPIVVVYDVDGVASGTYSFHDEDSTLRYFSAAPTRAELDDLTFNQGFAQTCAYALLLVSDMDELTWKYRTPSAYRLAWADAGAMLQTLSLVSTARGLGSVPTGAMQHESVRARFQLHPSEFATFFVFVGRSESGSTVAKLRAGQRR
jgi:SagB-type dehydrogenase family enzyme